MGKKKNQKSGNVIKKTEEQLNRGIALYQKHPLFSRLAGRIYKSQTRQKKSEWAAHVTGSGQIIVNESYDLSAEEWAYVIAHCDLHLAFGHFDAEKIPTNCNTYLWNMACDIYVAKFLADIKFGKAICTNPSEALAIGQKDEVQIYEYLKENHFEQKRQEYGTAAPGEMDMSGLDYPIVYPKGKENYYAVKFARALVKAASEVVTEAGGYTSDEMTDKFSKSSQAAQWFINHYPLLGGVAAGFQIIESWKICEKEEVQIAAVNVQAGKIYVNPTANLQEEELRFVLAQEFLHAGLQHQERCQGRDPYLWNVACDYVINGWLLDMRIGKMPDGVLFDDTLKKMSAEEVYDKIIMEIRKYMKENTLRGYGKGDLLGGGASPAFGSKSQTGVSLDEFFKDALAQGLEYHLSLGRGYIPAGLVEEIRALAMPSIPWDVELAEWFDNYFPALEKKRSYARPSRRQGATPEIPRPGYLVEVRSEDARTFGVVIDTSGSMSTKLLGMALGSIASYAVAREVPYVRVVFCDAAAYDAGYLAPEEIDGRVEVKGRGGTKLQPGVDLLNEAEDFPGQGPILIITDGEIESKMTVHQEHAFLVPKGKRLPFRTRGKVFYFE